MKRIGLCLLIIYLILNISNSRKLKTKTKNLANFKDNYYTIVARHTNKCLDSVGFGDGFWTYQWDCHALRWQQYKFQQLEDGSVMIYSRYNGQVLTARDNGTGDGTPIDTRTSADGNNQKWRVEYSSEPGIFSIKSIVDPNKCMEIDNNQGHNGAHLILRDCDGKQSQKWSFYLKEYR
jgi:hypothetical protein